MILLHCADLHLDSSLRTRMDREKAGKRRHELLHNFERMADYADDNGVEVILISGDLFDRDEVSALTRNTVLSVIDAHPDIRFYYLRGNHDLGDCLRQNDRTPPANLFLFGNRWRSYRDGNGGIIITGLELTRDTSPSVYDSLNLDPDDFNIVMLHGALTGTGRAHFGMSGDGGAGGLSGRSGEMIPRKGICAAGAGDPRHEAKQTGGNAGAVDLRVLRGRGIDYLALGHIHQGKSGPLDERGIYVYPGCLEGRGFDEPGPHGFMLLDIDERARRMRRRFIPFAKRTLHAMEIDVAGCRTTAQMKTAVDETLKQAGCGPQDMVEATLRGELDVECEKDTGYIQESLRTRYFFARVLDRTVLHVDPEDYRYDETLRGEFVRQVLADPSIEAEEKAAVIRCGFLAMDGESPL